MSVKIKVLEKEAGESGDFIDPVEVLGYLYGTVFQQYFDDEAQSTFWVSCGHGEKSVITVWFEDESNEWRLSTDNKKSLKEFVPQVKALLVDRADIKLKLKFIK